MKNAILTFASIVFALGFSSSKASADATVDSVKDFNQYITYLQKAAPQALALGQLDAGIVYLRNETRLEFSPQTLASLSTIATNQARFWSDTVSAEIQTQGQLQIDTVEALYAGSTLIGYRVTYGQVGYDMDSCKSANIATCHIGEVREAVFVTPDFQHVEVDHGLVASLQF